MTLTLFAISVEGHKFVLQGHHIIQLYTDQTNYDEEYQQDETLTRVSIRLCFLYFV